MNLKDISTELSKINAKIDNFARTGTAAMADQRKLLENMDNRIFALAAAFPSPATNEMEAMRREFTALQSTLMAKLAEQKQSYENQLEETRAKTEEAVSSLRIEVETVRREMSEQKVFYVTQLAKERAETDEALTSLKNENGTMRLALADKNAEIENIRHDFGALQATLTSKITEMIDRTPAYDKLLPELEYKVNKLTINDDLRDDMSTIIFRKMHKAFDECPYFEKTPEKFNQVYEKIKRDLYYVEKTLMCKRTQDMVEEITKSQRFQNLCKHDSNFLILKEGASIISTEQQNYKGLATVSIDYIKLILALLEYV